MLASNSGSGVHPAQGVLKFLPGTNCIKDNYLINAILHCTEWKSLRFGDCTFSPTLNPMLNDVTPTVSKYTTLKRCRGDDSKSFWITSGSEIYIIIRESYIYGCNDPEN